MLEFQNVCESFTLVLKKITWHRTPLAEKNKGMQLEILVILVMRSHISVSKKE